ncbi:MAG: cytidylate kinase-like family protein [Bacteroidota bacterium]|nr:cytidylate kinase-like family protein [Bacteroidota bacterium]MDP4205942.1 cytidylate kinase-like family protein [Bacteroidota bacterium]
MRKINLLEYMNRRMNVSTDKSSDISVGEGPVVTISREAGCPGKKIAALLKETLDSMLIQGKWTVISKEILAQSAQELNLHPDRVRQVIDAEQRYALDEILAAFSEKQFKNENVIRNSVVEVVHAFASRGNCIILGRGGSFIASDIEKSLHIKLYAPLEWRVQRVMKRKNMTHVNALKVVEQIDKERASFRKLIKGKTNVGNEDYDIIINCARIGPRKIVSMIIHLMQSKRMLNPADLKHTTL